MSETNKQTESRLDKLQFFEGREIRSVWVEDEACPEEKAS